MNRIGPKPPRQAAGSWPPSPGRALSVLGAGLAFAACALIPAAQGNIATGPGAQPSALQVPQKFKDLLNDGSKKKLEDRLDTAYKLCKSSPRAEVAIVGLATAQAGELRFGKRFEIKYNKLAKCATFRVIFDSREVHEGRISSLSSGDEVFEVHGEATIRYDLKTGFFEQVGEVGILEVRQWAAVGSANLGDETCSYHSTHSTGSYFEAGVGGMDLSVNSSTFGEVEALFVDFGYPAFYVEESCAGEQRFEQDWKYYWGLHHQPEQVTDIAESCMSMAEDPRQCGPWHVTNNHGGPWIGPVPGTDKLASKDFYHYEEESSGGFYFKDEERTTISLTRVPPKPK